jgi:aminoglycoside N3'-acetyltransferase
MQATTPDLSVDHVAAQLRSLGMKVGGVLLAHSSYRAARPVASGPRGLIEAMERALGPDGTLVMPSWTGDDDSPFDPGTTPPADDLGVLPQTFWSLPGVERSDHAFAFAARGRQASAVVSTAVVLPPHRIESPVGRVLELDGQILLLGVGHDANTMLHLAEVLENVPYRLPKYFTALIEGHPRRIDYMENDHCCQRFALMDGWLRERGLQREGKVGYAHARLLSARDVVDVARAELRTDPCVFLHSRGAGCEECEAAWMSVG